jgi:Siphovirus Gp157
MSAALKTDPLPRLRLYEIPSAMAAIEAEIEANNGELPPDLEARLDAVEWNLADRVDAVASVAKQAAAEEKFAAAQVAALKALVEDEIERWTARKNAAANKATRLKSYLQTHLVAMKRTGAEGERFKVWIQRNSTPSISWTGPDEIPTEFAIIDRRLDVELAREAFKAGDLPEGFSAGIGSHLRIG